MTVLGAVMRQLWLYFDGWTVLMRRITNETDRNRIEEWMSDMAGIIGVYEAMAFRGGLDWNRREQRWVVNRNALMLDGEPLPPLESSTQGSVRPIVEPFAPEPSEGILRAAATPVDEVEWVDEDGSNRQPPSAPVLATSDELNDSLNNIVLLLQRQQVVQPNVARHEVRVLREMRRQPAPCRQRALLLVLGTVAAYMSSELISSPDSENPDVKRLLPGHPPRARDFARAGGLNWTRAPTTGPPNLGWVV